MPNLLRVSNIDTSGCQYCQMMRGAYYREGTEPPSYPLSCWGVPAHHKCVCQYIRFNIFLTENSRFLLAEDGKCLCYTSELVPVIPVGAGDIPGYPDKTEPNPVNPYRKKRKPPVKKPKRKGF